jgi:glycerophosphoryl diester phosphodiesterase
MLYLQPRLLILLLPVIVLAGCSHHRLTDMDVQGHRGCRGLMPENSIPAFERALELGANTLELDVVITGDSQVLVSHEAWFSHEFCLDSLGREINPEEEQQFNLHRMTCPEIRRFDCGSKVHPRFPQQKKMVVHKPLLREVITACEARATEYRRDLPYYNIEVKWEVGGEGIFQPPVEEFARLVLSVLGEFELGDRVNLQSFDLPTLREIHRQAPDMRLALLVDENEDYRKKYAELGFQVELLSPWFKLVDEEMITWARERGMKVVPWTVNDKADMERMVSLGVSGIITDYPDVLLGMVKASARD